MLEFRTFGLMRFSTVSFGNTSLAIAAQSAHQAALAELGSSNPVPSRGSQVRTAIVPPELPVEAGPGAILHRGTEGSNPSPSSSQSVSAVNPEAIGEKPRTLAAVCGRLRT